MVYRRSRNVCMKINDKMSLLLSAINRPRALFAKSLLIQIACLPEWHYFYAHPFGGSTPQKTLQNRSHGCSCFWPIIVNDSLLNLMPMQTRSAGIIFCKKNTEHQLTHRSGPKSEFCNVYWSWICYPSVNHQSRAMNFHGKHGKGKTEAKPYYNGAWRGKPEANRKISSGCQKDSYD